MEIIIPIVPRAYVSKSRVAAYHRPNTRNEDCRAHFQQLMCYPPRVHYCVEPTSHAYVLFEWMRAAAIFAFGRSQKKGKSQTILASTHFI